MMYLFYILVILFLSCESMGLGVNENIATPLYHDCVALGWQYFFEDDYEEALNWFNTAYSATDETYHNSAHVGKGWTYLFQSNLAIGDSISVEELRALARNEFNYTIEESAAIESYADNCLHTYCCDDCFAKDREFGYLVDQLELKTRDSDTSQNEIDNLITQLEEFIEINNNYDFMEGKPPGLEGESITLDIDNVILYLVQIYLRNNEIIKSCELLKDTKLECEDDCYNIEIDSFLDCIESYSPI